MTLHVMLCVTLSNAVCAALCAAGCDAACAAMCDPTFNAVYAAACGAAYCPEIERDWNLKWFYPTYYKYRGSSSNAVFWDCRKKPC